MREQLYLTHKWEPNRYDNLGQSEPRILGGSAGCASALEISSGLRGPSPQAFPKKGNADGAEGLFGLAGRVWTSAL